MGEKGTRNGMNQGVLYWDVDYFSVLVLLFAMLYSAARDLSLSRYPENGLLGQGANCAALFCAVVDLHVCWLGVVRLTLFSLGASALLLCCAVELSQMQNQPSLSLLFCFLV